jgi:uncharacterized protein
MIENLLVGSVIGAVAGFSSGLLGTSPGGGLVVFSSLLLGVDQQVAQGVSLIAQVPPTSLSGIARYRTGDARSPWRWLVLIGLGSMAGGVAGAYAAVLVSATALRWTYVGYLVVLGALLVLRGKGARRDALATIEERQPVHWAALLAIGVTAGLSAGFLGIGGGLAIVVGLGVLLRQPQHDAQMISLVLSILPINLPAALVYLRVGWVAPWPTVIGVIAGLVLGTDAGARLATRTSGEALRRLTLVMIIAMAAYVAYKAVIEDRSICDVVRVVCNSRSGLRD